MTQSIPQSRWTEKGSEPLSVKRLGEILDVLKPNERYNFFRLAGGVHKLGGRNSMDQRLIYQDCEVVQWGTFHAMNLWISVANGWTKR